MVYKYPQEIHDFVKEQCVKLRDDDLAEACNELFGTCFTAQTMKSFRGNHGYRSGKKQWTKEEYWKYQKRYPKGMYEFVRDNSWGVSSKEMADMVNEKFGTEFTQTMMKQFRQRHGIRSGCTGWYQRGHAPGTKGKTLEEICGYDPEKIEKVRATQFKKGDRPANELPIGAITVNSYGYKIRKRAMEGKLWDRWEFLHRAVWEEHHGPVPDDMVVTFLDSNKLNCDISNLALVTKAENWEMTRMGLRFDDPDLTEAGIGVVRLKKAIREKRKQRRKAHENHDG